MKTNAQTPYVRVIVCALCIWKMWAPCSLQAYIGLIPVFGNLNLGKMPLSNASQWGSLRWVRAGSAQKVLVMQKFPGQPSSLLGWKMTAEQSWYMWARWQGACLALKLFYNSSEVLLAQLWRTFLRGSKGSQGVAASGDWGRVCHLLICV